MCVQVRRGQLQQLRQFLDSLDATRDVLVGGDFNINGMRRDRVRRGTPCTVPAVMIGVQTEYKNLIDTLSPIVDPMEAEQPPTSDPWDSLNQRLDYLMLHKPHSWLLQDTRPAPLGPEPGGCSDHLAVVATLVRGSSASS